MGDSLGGIGAGFRNLLFQVSEGLRQLNAIPGIFRALQIVQYAGAREKQCADFAVAVDLLRSFSNPVCEGRFVGSRVHL